MPVIYDKAMGRQWLEQSFGASSMSRAAVLQPLPSETVSLTTCTHHIDVIACGELHHVEVTTIFRAGGFDLEDLTERKHAGWDE
jgi:hypothetical protein